jgi:putative SOS response-associated peptidase YedK
MCGRFTLSPKGPDFLGYFEIMESLDFTPRYNIFPGQDVLIIRNDKENKKRESAFVHWGLIPHWQKEEDIGTKWINARSETITEKKLFNKSFQSKRCLIVADGFYEWETIENSKIKQPYYFHQKDHHPFGFAGIWEHWENSSGKTIDSCCILTTSANQIVSPVHNRMPIIIPRESHKTWLDSGSLNMQDFDKITHLSMKESNLTRTPVSTYVNSPTNQDKKCIDGISV